MMAFPSMLLDAARQAKMKTPPDDDKLDEMAFDKDKYPHFWIYCQLQLGRPISWGEHWDNAKVISRIPLTKLKKMRLDDFIAAGLHFQS